ncbi:MAG: hypothetical protein EXR68_03445 [Dehalococcoidia bacterium]|nr:hypothetical protein [Dehalococcoidia bacterium]
MGRIQVRLFLSYFVVIGVTLGLAALSLFLLLGGYREDISRGNLEDLGTLLNRQIGAELQRAAPETGDRLAADLVTNLRRFLSPQEAASSDISVALVDARGNGPRGSMGKCGRTRWRGCPGCGDSPAGQHGPG